MGPVTGQDGKPTGEESCRFVHLMTESRRPFTIVVQRREKAGQQRLAEAEDSQRLLDRGYLYRAIATNRELLSDSGIIHGYNQRGEHSENRLKELKSRSAPVP